MKFTHTIAAGLAGILLVQSAGLAQTPLAQATLAIPREQAIHVLVANIKTGSQMRIELANGDRLEGQLVDKSDEELVVFSGGQRQVIDVPDIVSVRLPVRPGMTSGKAFGISAATSAGAFLGWFIVLMSGGFR